jgi:hypothetical protein
MVQYPGVKVVTTAIHGSTTPRDIVAENGCREYLALYAKVGDCFVSFGDADHTACAIVIKEGTFFETNVTIHSKVRYSGSGTTLVAMYDANLTHGRMLTYDNIPLIDPTGSTHLFY